MEAAKKARAVARTVFTRTSNDVEKLLDHEEVDLAAVEIKWKFLLDKYQLMKTADREVWELLLQNEDNEEILVTEVNKSDEYAFVFLKLEQRYQNLHLQPEDNGSQRSAVSTNSMNRKFKLPVLELKKFGGDIRDWLSFWSQFQKIHADPGIHTEDKFQYLIQSMLKDSRARAVVESFPPTKENYEKAIESLKARFGREELLVEVYVRELLKLVLQNNFVENKCNLSVLYDKLETQLRALESLGVTSDKCAAMLFPLVESCLPEELLRTWQRNSGANCNEAGENKDRLKAVMRFLKQEVENEERIALAIEGFGISMTDSKTKRSKPKYQEHAVPTATSLVNSTSRTCIFCGKGHFSENCFKAQKMNLQEKRKFILKTKVCFICFKSGHQSAKCTEQIRCPLCGGRHATIMCAELPVNKTVKFTKSDKNKEKMETPSTVCAENTSLANLSNPVIFLQTLRVKIKDGNKEKEVRALIDTGSQRSYILKSTAEFLGLPSKRVETLRHVLFGGSVSPQEKHKCYDITLTSLDNKYACTLETLDQVTICNNIPPVPTGHWTKELENRGIFLTDVQKFQPIELLIGADAAGKLLNGDKFVMDCGLTALGTFVGWTLIGRVETEEVIKQAGVYLSMLTKDFSINELWKLETIGIMDPGEKRTKKQAELVVRQQFQQTVCVDETGRYEIQLPWVDGHPPIPRNEKLATSRLNNSLVKLKNEGYIHDYDQVFQSWLSEGIIEEVPSNEIPNFAHYLPHRPVIKTSSLTTKIRPVFDASAHEKNKPSLNNCLEVGENLIELIPNILLKFRLYKYGLSADICKAFLQIGIAPWERDFLRFLWINKDGNLLHMRHRRVVFGLCCSPFLLGATIQHHLTRMLSLVKDENRRKVVKKLLHGFYVDNCLVSVQTAEEAKEFQNKASEIMLLGKFDLRGWEISYHSMGNTDDTPVLGMLWNSGNDTLSINENCLKGQEILKITKREILSLVQKIFDPIGHLSPTLLIPKILLQKIWSLKLNWDAEVPEDIKKQFLNWWDELPILKSIKLPRWINGSFEGRDKWSLHTFVDASQESYAAVVFLRVEFGTEVKIHILQAKARVAPMKTLTIPRLELLAACIGARLYDSVKNALNMENIMSYFWSDSSTVLAWIKREEQWATFVWNRINEIRLLTSKENWKHVPGNVNPADLLSRGCSPHQLVQSRWWEGPKWLYGSPQSWLNMKEEIDLNSVLAEKKKSVISTMTVQIEESLRFYEYFSSYNKMVRMVAWMSRFMHNSRHPLKKLCRELSSSEFFQAEMLLLRLVQQESFQINDDNHLKGLEMYTDENGVYRLKTRISNRNDTTDFRFPILLPTKHPVVERLIQQYHVKNCHIGTQGLIAQLRERFWIFGGRKPIKDVIKTCVRCKRYTAKSMQVNTPPLPVNRVKDAHLFEVVGVDFAGPVYIPPNKKAWICLFTCAIYRAVHLELATSLSTNTFLQSLRRFIARRGRPKIIYSDNGTNFVGAKTAISTVDWKAISQYSAAQQIEWKLNPPSAAWWGGWWERLIGLLKNLLRRILARASLHYEEFLTVLCECEAVMNNRPLTYISNDPTDLIPLTPATFMRELSNDDVPDLDAVDNVSLNDRVKYLKKIRDDLRSRFRSEYLGLLKQNAKKDKKRQIVLNELVLVGNDITKRINWPLGRVIELLPGQDGVVRVVRVRTAKGVLTRPVQRLFPLECSATTSTETAIEPKQVSTEADQREPFEAAPTTAFPKEKNADGEVYTTKRGRRVISNRKVMF